MKGTRMIPSENTPPRKPDFGNLLKILERKRPDRPTLFEFFLNLSLYERFSGIPCNPEMDFDRYRHAVLGAFYKAGYDYATIHASLFGFQLNERRHAQTVSLNEGAPIGSWNDFERYAWHRPSEFDYDILERLRPEIPEGMKLIVPGPGGVLENLISLLGYDRLCYLLVDDPKLVQAVTNAIGERLLEHYRIVLEYDTVGAIISNDDWGFKTQPMLSPHDMRTYILPWHRRIAREGHAAGRPVILHSCGNLTLLMDEIIDDLGYDGKHSFEDNIQPVEEAYAQYAGRVAILGGIDLDFIVRSDPEAVRRRARAMLERSAGGGGYALGTGNSVPEYVPPENYLAMISAAFE